MRFFIAIFILFAISANVIAIETQTDLTTPKNILTENSKFDCVKKYCKNMRSCEEACYKLKFCGHSQLDRDKDKIPCEKICFQKCK